MQWSRLDDVRQTLQGQSTLMLERLYQNHVLANLVYALLLILGVLAYLDLPKEQQPNMLPPGMEISIEWPGASAEDVERWLVDPLEGVLRAKIKDIRHLYSSSQANVAGIELLFEDIPKALYERRQQEVRRELQALTQSALPKEALITDIFEKTSFSGDWYKIVVYSPGDDENFRRQARQIKRDLERIPGILGVWEAGLEAPELQVIFHPERLPGLGISATALAETVRGYFRDIPAGTVRSGDQEWLVRILGTENAASGLASLPITAAKGSVRLGELAEIQRGSRPVMMGSRFRRQPAVTLMPFKQPTANTLDVVNRLKAYIDARNRSAGASGVSLYLLQDTSDHIRNAVKVMESHAWSGLALVVVVVWLALGTRLALLASLAVPFSLAGVFVLLQVSGQSMNLSVLLGIVIALGMLVDDAIVVIEAISQQLQRGFSALQATVDAVREVWLPVLTSSLTTMASFVPLMTGKGELAMLMGVVPQTVCVALSLSLVMALWILPAQTVQCVSAQKLRGKRVRIRMNLQAIYARQVIGIMRRPRRALLALAALFSLAGTAIGQEWVQFTLFPPAPTKGFHAFLEMPVGTPMSKTEAALEQIEGLIVQVFQPGEMRASAIEIGGIEKDGMYYYGHQYGEIWVSLNPEARNTEQIILAAKARLKGFSGPVSVWMEGDGRNPGGKPIQLALTGEAGNELDDAVEHLKAILSEIPAVHDTRVDVIPGLAELRLRLDGEAIQRAGVDPETVSRNLQLLAAGEIVASFADQNEQVAVRVKAVQSSNGDIASFLRFSVPGPDGRPIPLAQLVRAEQRIGPSNITHADFKRYINIQAELDKARLDTLAANQLIRNRWEQSQVRFPNINVDFNGELQAIKESLNQLAEKFVLGLGLIFLIVGAQFRSYSMPFLILLKIPMAFSGVVLGLLISREPMSLYTLYGAVALAGIAVNSAILMFAAGQDRLRVGIPPARAAVSAARRRLLPILITSVTTLVGLLPLALGSENSSTLWRPVATAIVWGVGFSTVMTLFIVPLLFHLTATRLQAGPRT